MPDPILQLRDISTNKTKRPALEKAYILTKHIDILIGFWKVSWIFINEHNWEVHFIQKEQHEQRYGNVNMCVLFGEHPVAPWSVEYMVKSEKAGYYQVLKGHVQENVSFAR